MGANNGLGVMLLQERKSGEMKQLEAPESNSTWIRFGADEKGKNERVFVWNGGKCCSIRTRAVRVMQQINRLIAN
jgi:hypothetical protein